MALSIEQRRCGLRLCKTSEGLQVRIPLSLYLPRMMCFYKVLKGDIYLMPKYLYIKVKNRSKSL